MTGNDIKYYGPIVSLVLLILAGVTGWVMNIIKLIEAEVMSGLVIARIAGIFIAPLGSVLGFL